MDLDWTYRPRRQRRRGCFVWSGLVLLLAVYLYVQRPDWLVRQPPPPATTPTPSALYWQTKAEAHIAAGNFSEAAAALERMAELEPENAYPLVALAGLHLMARRVEQAYALTQKAVRLEGKNVDALAMHARVLDWRGNYDSASDFAFQALELEPDNPDVLAVLGEIYSDVGNYAVALDYLEEALAIDPANVMARRNLGYLYEIQKEHESAISEYSRAIELAPKRPDLFIELGRQYERLDEWGLAIETYEEAVAAGETAFALDALGWALWNYGDHLQALRILRRAAEMEPENGLVLAHLGMAYYRRLNYESASETLEQAMELLDEDEINAQFTLTLGLSHVYKKPQECDRAVPWLNKTLEFAPGLSSALHGLRRCSTG
ncbi:MAG: tetratricopeptide repeat protein [Caldilineaceae bacterium SB0665_bin_25]|nr:tetratricopeptide repeat protein [Caldilineaceae bacterium SB0665_bin_25]